MPYSIGQLVPYETETQYDSGDYLAALDRCLKEFGWDEKIRLWPEADRWPLSWRCRVPFVESGGAGPRENVRMTLGPDGKITSASALPCSARGWKPCLPRLPATPWPCHSNVPHSPWLDHYGRGRIRHLSFPRCRHGRLGNSGDAKKLRPAIRAAAAIQFGCGAEAVTVADGRATASDGRP